MKNEIREEAYRKISHLTLGSICLSLIYFLKLKCGLNILLNVGFWVLLFTLVLEHLRIERGKRIFYLSAFVRKDEKDNLHQFTYTLLAALLCLAFFEFKIAFAALCISIFGDAAAAIARFITKRKIIIWTIMTLISLIISFVLGMKLIGIPMAIVASFVEIMNYKISDNLTIPLFAGGIGELFSSILSIF